MEPISDFFKSALFFIVATFGVNVGTDEPKYRVIEMIDQQTEIRLYAPRLAAEIHISKTAEAKMESMAFGKLAEKHQDRYDCACRKIGGSTKQQDCNDSACRREKRPAINDNEIFHAVRVSCR